MTAAPDTGNETGALDRMAVGRLALAAAALAAPSRFARIVGVRSSPELTYMTRIYGARALVMGLGYLTGNHAERLRWQRFGLIVDTSDTIAGITHLLRGDVPARATALMLTLTGSYAVIGAIRVLK